MSETTRYFDARTIETVHEVFGSKEGRFNPRTLSNPGFAPEGMERLRRGICKDGLNHSLLVRLVDGKPKVVAGERRLRAILGLMEADEEAQKKIAAGDTTAERVMVMNQRTKKKEPALDVYGKQGVECKICDAKDEKDALRQAIVENTLHEGLTEFELLLQCEKMEKAGISRAEQAEIVDMSEAWISQSHSLLNAHHSILKYMESGKLTRTAALTFLNVDDDKVEATLKRAIDLTYKEAEMKEIQAQAELDRAMEEIQLGEGALRISKYTGDHESARKARKQVARASRAAQKAQGKVKSAQAKKKKTITVDTINKAAQDVDADVDLKRPQTMKNIRLIEGEIGDLLKEGDVAVLTNPANGQEYDRGDMEIVHLVLGWALNHNNLAHPLDAIVQVRGEKKAKPKKAKK